MKCIGYWKENLKSYLVTYDELDPDSKYRCWVYQRADLNRVLISQAVGPYCNLKQDVTSQNATEGASVALELEVRKNFFKNWIMRLKLKLQCLIYYSLIGIWAWTWSMSDAFRWRFQSLETNGEYHPSFYIWKCRCKELFFFVLVYHFVITSYILF